jgi:CRISPR-associated protein Cas1
VTPADELAEDDAAPVPARMLNELVYCPRLFWLEHVAGEWDDSADTLQGNRVHKRVDARSTALPAPGELPEEFREARSVSVGSAREGITAKVDLVESEGGEVVPVDYKRGAAPERERVPGGAWPADRVQVGAQAEALREAGYTVREAALYYAQSKTRVRVPVDDALVAEVRGAVAEARRVRRLTVAPPPLVASPKCPRCSLVGICLPDEITALQHEGAAPTAERSAANDTVVATGPAPAPVTESESASDADDVAESPRRAREAVRKLVPARDDRMPLYVQAHGAVIGRDGDCLKVRLKDGTSSTARLRELSQVNVLGNVTLTAPALQELCQRGIDVGLFGFGGWHYGSVGGFPEKNVLLRVAQFATAADPARCLALARELVAGKVLNARTLLRRNADGEADETLTRLKWLALRAGRVNDLDSLLGVEGTAARVYFEAYAKLLAPRSGGAAEAFAFEERNRRPPRDPVNAMLSFGYALLVKDCRVALKGVGFDVMVGVYHRPRHGRPALALDLMEEFRPLIVDSVVLAAVNTEAVRPEHFVRAAGGCALTDDGRRAFLAAYERRMETEVTHPLFGYTITYRRVLEVQARLLARTIEGELARYPSFRTR